jgi:hypothetical protein
MIRVTAFLIAAPLLSQTYSPIFDGKSLNGWKHEGAGKIEVADAAIRITHPGGGSGLSFVTTEGEFADFALRLLYKAVKGNSGVFFRMGDAAARDYGYEIEVDPARDPGGFQEPGKRNWIIRTGPVDPAVTKTPAAAAGLKPAAEYYRVNDWNEMIISAQGGDITVKINGYTTTALKDDPGRRSGRIALQVNPRQELEVYYKDIGIQGRSK